MERMSSYEQERENLERFKRFVRLNTGNMATVMICALFFCSAFLTPGHGENVSIVDIVISSFLGFWASTAINSLYNNKGLVEGMLSTEVVDATKNHNERIDEIIDENAMDDLHVWCVGENEKNYRNQRTRILSKAGLSYDMCFTESGEYKQVEIRPPERSEIKRLGFRMWCIRKATAKRQIKAYIRAVHLRLTELSAGELTGEGNNRDDPFYMGRGVSEYKKQVAAKNTFSKIVLSLVVGYMTVDMIADFSWFKLMIRAVQIVMFLVVGLTQYLNMMDYVTIEYKNRLVRKERILHKFLIEKKNKTAPPAAVNAEEERSDTNNDKVSRKLGHPDHKGSGTGQTDRELHAVAS